MKKNVAILHQGFIPTYRVKTFQLLHELGSNQYTVFHGAAPQNTGHRAYEGELNFPNVKVRNFELSVARKSVVYQAVVRQLVFGPYDAAVLGHEVKFISNLMVFALFKLLRRPVIWWGHGFEKAEDANAKLKFLAPAIASAKVWLAKAADQYMVYTESGARKLKESGIPDEKLVVIRNTLDMDEQSELHACYLNADPAALRQRYQLQPNSVVLVYLGRLYREKRLEEFVELIRRLNADGTSQVPVEGVIIGDGPEAERLRSLASDLPQVHFTGALFDQDAIAQYLRVASAMVIPGKVGLAVNHAFAHGLPLLTRESSLHAPEVEYIEPGVNGAIIPGSFDVFVQQVAAFINSPELQTSMSQAALRTRETLSLKSMVLAFDRAVNLALQQAEPVPSQKLFHS